METPASPPEPPVGKRPPLAELCPRQRDWRMLVAYLHLEQQKPDKACVLLRLAAQTWPEDPEVLRCLALGELLAGSPGAAARAATRAFKQSNEDLHVPVGLVFAKALWEQGQQEAARDFLANLLTPTSA